MPERDLQVFADAGALAAAAAGLFERLAAEAIDARGVFSIALSGGSTPRRLFSLLAGEGFCNRVLWPAVEVFWSDERCVPPDDAQSNYRMAQETLLDRVPLSPDRIHRMPADQAPLAAAADAYAVELRRAVGAGSDGTPRFDLVMLGMGDDGHTASLFPETAALDERERLVAPNYVPKLDAHRLTFTPTLINAAAHVLFLVAGDDKAPALQEVLEGARRPRLYPSQLIAPQDGVLHWFLDRAAAAGLTRT